MEALIFDIVIALIGAWLIKLGWSSENSVGMFVGILVGGPFMLAGVFFFFMNVGMI